MVSTMKKFGIDLHAATGGAGLLGSAIWTHWNALAGGIAATATAVYMGLRAAREWVKLRRDLKEKAKPNEPDND